MSKWSSWGGLHHLIDAAVGVSVARSEKVSIKQCGGIKEGGGSCVGEEAFLGVEGQNR